MISHFPVFRRFSFAFLFLSFCGQGAFSATHYVSPQGGNVPPFNDWSGAATNIQDAIEIASTGDVVLVTNGYYSFGGKAMAGNLTNRVAIDKGITVQSVNGPAVTAILGRFSPAATNTRCAWLTNGAVLSGFHCLFGITASSGDPTTLMSGGNIWCASASAVVTNCVLYGGRAYNYAGGIYGGTIKNCKIFGGTSQGHGGGAYGSVLVNCLVLGNTATFGAWGTYGCTLSNCTITRNSGQSSSFFGSMHDSLYNCIVYFNSDSIGTRANYDQSTFSYSCTIPGPFGGVSNINSDPQFIDSFHLSSTSPCRGKGKAGSASGVDIDGQSYGTPPPMGCDEYHNDPTINLPDGFQPGSKIGEAMLAISALGAPPISYWWSRDGVDLEDGPHYANAHSTNLIIKEFNQGDGGFYKVTASNSFGMVTSPVMSPTVRCVDAASVSPAMPYLSWNSAAQNIQDALNAAAGGDVVVVTNGIYNSGSYSDSTFMCRIGIGYKYGVLILSCSGPGATIIEGRRSNPTNNIQALMCASIGFGTLSGFTLRNGECDGFSAGGIEGLGSAAAFCIISNNISTNGPGGVYNCNVRASLLTGNSGTTGACLGGSLNNCTVVYNSAPASGAGVAFTRVTNSIVYFSFDSTTGQAIGNYTGSTMQNSCSVPLPAGAGNLSGDPLLVDPHHLAFNSPCRGAGAPPYLSAADLDGEPWQVPPSIGVDEAASSSFVGPLTLDLSAGWVEVPVGHAVPLIATVNGKASSLLWNFDDGLAPTNLSYSISHSWTNAGDYLVNVEASNESNPAGVSASLTIHVVPLAPPLLTGTSLKNGVLTLSSIGQGGVNYAFEKCTNLAPPVTWQAVTTKFSNGGPMNFADVSASNAAAFYRLRFQ